MVLSSMAVISAVKRYKGFVIHSNSPLLEQSQRPFSAYLTHEDRRSQEFLATLAPGLVWRGGKLNQKTQP